jgi:hypothetical protein
VGLQEHKASQGAAGAAEVGPDVEE